MRLVSLKDIRKSSLRGFAMVELSNGLTLIESPIHLSQGNSWPALPARPVFGVDGSDAEASGKKIWAPMLRWPSRETEQVWSARVVKLVRERHPDALE